MDLKVKLSADAVLNKTFAGMEKGYDPYAVDLFLDQVLSDYSNFENVLREREDYIAKLETSIKRQKDQISNLEIENAKYQNRLGSIKDEGKVSVQNIDYLKRIAALEKKLFELGVDPSKVR